MRFRLTPPRPQITENDVEADCLFILKRRGWYVLRLHVGLFKTREQRWITMGEPGLPDYVALHARYPGFFLEVKRPGAKVSEDQQQKHLELSRFYSLAIAVVDDREHLIRWLFEHERSASALLA